MASGARPDRALSGHVTNDNFIHADLKHSSEPSRSSKSTAARQRALFNRSRSGHVAPGGPLIYAYKAPGLEVDLCSHRLRPNLIGQRILGAWTTLA